MAVFSRLMSQMGTILIYVFSFTAALSFNEMMNRMFKNAYGNTNSLHARTLFTIIMILIASIVATCLVNDEEYSRYRLEKQMRRQSQT